MKEKKAEIEKSKQTNVPDSNHDTNSPSNKLISDGSSQSAAESFEEVKQQLLGSCILEEFYESPKTYESVFIDSESLMHVKQTGSSGIERTSPQVTNILNKTKPSSDVLSPEFIQKRDDGIIYVPSIDQSFGNLLEFIKFAMTKWSFEQIMTLFDWKDFEIIIRDILSECGFVSFRTFRFSAKGKRHEVDIVAKSGDTIFFIDGKHWQTNTPGVQTFRKIGAEQRARVDALVADKNAAGTLLLKLHTSLEENKNKPFKIYPIIVISFNEPQIRWVDSIPIVPIHTFNQFILNFHVFRPQFYSGLLKNVVMQETLANTIKKSKKKQNKNI